MGPGRGALLVSAAALGGCNAILGIGDFTTGSGDDMAIDAAPLDADPTLVRGTSIISHVRLDATIEMAPEDLSAYTIKAYVPAADGTFTVVDGAGHADGTFEIAGVPPGATYYLELLYPAVPNHADPIPYFFVTDDHDLDLGYTVMGRADGVEATQTSQVVLDLTGLSPWTTNDILAVDSYNNGSEFGDMSRSTNLPAPGATTTVGMSFDWRDGYTYHPIGSLPRLIDSAAGDDVFVAQLHTEEQLAGPFEYLLTQQVGVLKRTDLTQTNGTPLEISGALSPVTLDQVQNVGISLSLFRSQYSDSDRRVGEAIAIQTVDNAGTQYQQMIGFGPWTLAFGTGFFPTLFGLGDFATVPAFMFGESDQYPTSWGRVVVTTYVTRRGSILPGVAGIGAISMVMQSYAPATNPLSVVPQVRPIVTLDVGGNTDYIQPGAVPFDGTHGVVVSWDHVLQADGYRVLVIRYFRDGSASRGENVLAIDTRDTSVTIPPDLLMKGQRYGVTVVSLDGLDDSGLRRYRSPASTAQLNTNIFLFSDACGDGATDTDLGEECDTAGPSADCDPDCSLPACGDAYLNTFASEVCDDGGDTPSCDRNCTAVVCGDGLFNNQAEACDDGNTTETGNGCSSTCTRAGTCGDSIVQTWFEQCDPPNGTTCSATCGNL